MYVVPAFTFKRVDIDVLYVHVLLNVLCRNFHVQAQDRSILSRVGGTFYYVNKVINTSLMRTWYSKMFSFKSWMSLPYVTVYAYNNHPPQIELFQ